MLSRVMRLNFDARTLGCHPLRFENYGIAAHPTQIALFVSTSCAQKPRRARPIQLTANIEQTIAASEKTVPIILTCRI
jgi:hypothetical protein